MIFHCMAIQCFVYPFGNLIFGLFPLLTIMNNADITFVWTYLFISLGYLPSRIARLYGSFISNFLRNRPTVFQSGCLILHSCQQCILRVLLSLHPNGTYLLPVLYIIAIEVHVKWCLMVLVCYFSND